LRSQDRSALTGPAWTLAPLWDSFLAPDNIVRIAIAASIFWI